MATEQDNKEEQVPQFDYEDLDERTKKQIKNAFNTQIKENDKVLNELIDGNIECKSRDDCGFVMHRLTEFANGYVYKDDERIIKCESEDLTSLVVMFFSYEYLLDAIDFAFAVGVENSVILMQDSPATDVEILYEDLKDLDINSPEAETPPYGWLVVFKDLRSLDEAQEALDNAVREEVIDAQNKKFNDITGFKQGHWLDVNYRDELRKAQAKIFDKYSKNPKIGYEEQRKLLRKYEYNPDVLFNTIEHHKEIYEKLLANETKE